MYYENFKKLRRFNNKSQVEIANYLGVKQNTYSCYENGTRKAPIDVYVALARYYNTTIDYIVGLTDIK